MLLETDFLFFSWAQSLHFPASLVARGTIRLISGQKKVRASARPMQNLHERASGSFPLCLLETSVPRKPGQPWAENGSTSTSLVPEGTEYPPILWTCLQLFTEQKISCYYIWAISIWGFICLAYSTWLCLTRIPFLLYHGRWSSQTFPWHLIIELLTLYPQLFVCLPSQIYSQTLWGHELYSLSHYDSPSI